MAPFHLFPWKAWTPSLTFLPSCSGPIRSLAFYSFHLLNISIICFVFFFLHIDCHSVNLATFIACIINPCSPWTGLSVLVLPSSTHTLLYTFVRMIFMILIMAFSYLNTLNYMVFQVLSPFWIFTCGIFSFWNPITHLFFTKPTPTYPWDCKGKPHFFREVFTVFRSRLM